MLVTKKRYKKLEKEVVSFREDENVFIQKFIRLASRGKTYAQIASILNCEVEYLYAKARKHKITVQKPWQGVAQYFTTMLEMHIQGSTFKQIADKYSVSAPCIHKIFARNGYIDFTDDKIKHNTKGAQEFAEKYKEALRLELKK